MRGLLLCCLLALAASENLRYDLVLDSRKTYEYKYVGMVNFGRGLPNLAESGVRLLCKAKVSNASPQTFLLQVSDLAFEEFNGFPGKSTFNASPKLSERIATQLTKPFMFEYANGRVGNIQAPAEVSDTIVNIVRGILGFFHITVKTTQTIYAVEEIGIHGLCQSNYAVEDNLATKEMIITQVVAFNNCRDKAAFYSGMATAVEDKIAREKGESIVSTVRYVYTIKPTANGGVITKARALEQQHFTPFNVKGGSFYMQATKEMELLGVTDTMEHLIVGPMEPKGSLVFKFVNDQANIPILMQNLDDPVPKVVELVKQLAQANIYKIDSPTTENVMKAYQLLRVVPFEGLEAMWKQFAGNEEQRRWFLNLIVEVNDARILKFLELRFKTGELSVVEAWQTLLLSFNHLQALPELVEMAKEFLTIPYTKSNPYIHQTVVLAYGSLVYKHCTYYTPCRVTAVQPLLDMALDGLKKGSEEDMVLALKALGNAGHPGSIKTIMRFLPSVAANPVELSPRVLSTAVQAMRHITTRDPHSVQDVTMSLFVQKSLSAEVRMLAFMVLFETKPPLALVSTVTAHLMEEKDLHVASFAYSYLRTYSRSVTPDNHYLSTACNVAVKILAPKFGRLSFRFSKALHIDAFNDDFLMGTSAELLMLRSLTSVFPTEMIMRTKYFFIGRTLQLLEFGFRAEEIKQLFGATIPGFKGDFSFSDIQAVFRVLQDWEKLPNDKPLLSLYSRASGQEWMFADLKKELVQSLLKAVSPSAGKDTPVLPMLDNLQKGLSWHWTKAFLIWETRYFQATTLGLPLEISKYYQTVNAITAKAKTSVNPPVTEHIGQLLTSEISLETDGFIGFTKDNWVFHGINTELFQCGTELKTKAPLSVPWSFSTRLNMREKKFELDFPPCLKEFELFSISSNVYAVSRNMEEPALAKMTPMMPTAIDANDEVSRVGPQIVKNEPKLMVEANMWHPTSKVCSESSIFGAGVCFDSELKRAFYHEEYPLYYFLGYTHLTATVIPVHPIKPVDKIHLEVNAGPGRHPLSMHQLLASLKRLSKEATNQLSLSSGSASSGRRSHHSHHDTITEMWNSAPQAVFDVKALAMSSSMKPEGFDAAVYYTPEANLENIQLIVSQIGEEANWKLCMDTIVDKAQVHAKAHMRWGAECQSYMMSMIASTAHLPGSKPTLKAKVHWSRIPEYLSAMGKRIERYVPGVALLLGFNQQHNSNSHQEVSAIVVATSADNIDVRVKFPEYTVYRQAIPIPFSIEGIQGVQQYNGNSTMDNIDMRA